MLIPIGLICLGLFLLVFGGHLLVRGATAIALLLRITPTLVGLTIVAVGTSLPELFVGLSASKANQNDLLLGNLIGSNLLNIALVIGLSAFILPITIERQNRVWGWPLMFLICILAGLGLYDFSLLRFESTILFLATVVVVVFFIHKESQKDSESLAKETEEVEALKQKLESGKRSVFILRYTAELILGFFLLRWGSDAFVGGSTQIAEIFYIDPRIIGLTLVAIGTSLPELAVSLVATFKGRSDVAIGNIIGSNIFNIGAILGICGFLKPISVTPTLMTYDFVWMLGITILFFFTLMKGEKIGRFKGGLLLLTYGIYTSTLFLGGAQ